MDIKQIAKTIAENNGRLYLVGGCVRDIILGVPPHDYDYCVVGLTQDLFENLFPNAIKQGKSFPVYMLENSEFALARTEKKSGSKHTDFEFNTSPNITIHDDLSRRDLTINSMAMDVLTNEIIDPFNGKEDIKNKILRMTSDAFIEDPLRVYRVARFSAELNFSVENTTLNMMKSMKNELSNLSVERVFTEFRKALISKNPTNFFNILRNSECLDVHFEEIFNLIGVEQPLIYHPEGDVYNHTMEVLERVSYTTTDELTRFGALVHDFGKAATPRENWPHHYEHDKLGVPLIRNFYHRLKMPQIYLKAGCISSNEHMLAGIYNRLKPGKKVAMFERVYKSKSLSLKGLEIIANSDTKKDSPITFADTATKVMENVKIDENDLLSINSISDPNQRIEKIQLLLRDKRIRYLLELEK